MSTKKLSKVSNLLKGEILKYIPNFFNIIKLSKQFRNFMNITKNVYLFSERIHNYLLKNNLKIYFLENYFKTKNKNFPQNTLQTIIELYTLYYGNEFGCSVHEFFYRFSKINNDLIFNKFLIPFDNYQRQDDDNIRTEKSANKLKLVKNILISEINSKINMKFISNSCNLNELKTLSLMKISFNAEIEKLFLENLIKKCFNLESLNLDFEITNKENIPFYFKLIQNNKNIRNLGIYNLFSEMSNLKEILNKINNLNLVDIISNKNLIEIIELLKNNCKNLNVLKIENRFNKFENHFVKNIDFVSSLSLIKYEKKLKKKKKENESNNNSVNIPKMLKKLKILYLKDLNNSLNFISWNILFEIFEKNKFLQNISLSLNYINFDNYKKLIDKFCELKFLNYLEIFSPLDDDQSIYLSTKLKNNSLRTLKINHSSLFKFKIFFKNCKFIRSINFILNNESSKFKFILPNTIKLLSISISNYPNITNSLDNILTNKNIEEIIFQNIILKKDDLNKIKDSLKNLIFLTKLIISINNHENLEDSLDLLKNEFLKYPIEGGIYY